MLKCKPFCLDFYDKTIKGKNQESPRGCSIARIFISRAIVYIF